MILTITLNPTIDKSSSIDKIQPEAKLRCGPLKHEPGGGGINVTKALHELGCSSTALFPSGGHNGAMLQTLLKKEGLNFHALKAENETRESFIILEESTNKQFRFNFPGKDADDDLLKEVINFIDEKRPDIVVASGSLPEGLNPESYAELAKHARQSGIRFILDTSGDALKAAANAGTFLLKPNIGELAKLLGKEKIEEKEIEASAKELIQKGFAEIVVVSLGEKGAVLVTKDEYHIAKAPKVEKRSTVGAGDSMVAGLVYMLSQNKPLEETLKFAIACGSAATMNAGTELFHKKDVELLYSQADNK